MKPVITDAVGHDGTLHILMLYGEFEKNLLKQLNPFLNGIQAGRPVKKHRLGIYRQTQSLLKLHQILPLRRHDIVIGTELPDQMIAVFRIHSPGRRIDNRKR